ncbi:MAG: heavy metal resistance protein, partial [Caulobacteraceae bacterium]
AIATEHAYGPRAQQAVERFHRAMGTLQEDTIRHVLTMRQVMTPDQARRFDVLIHNALKPPTA